METGTSTVNKGTPWGLTALNSLPSGKRTLFAVVTTKEPGISKLELGPKTTPLGLIKIKFASPNTPNFPNI